MNIFGWYFSCMHVLKRKNKESFDLVEFVASVSQVDFVKSSVFLGNRLIYQELFCVVTLLESSSTTTTTTTKETRQY